MVIRNGHSLSVETDIVFPFLMTMVRVTGTDKKIPHIIIELLASISDLHFIKIINKQIIIVFLKMLKMHE